LFILVLFLDGGYTADVSEVLPGSIFKAKWLPSDTCRYLWCMSTGNFSARYLWVLFHGPVDTCTTYLIFWNPKTQSVSG